MDVSVVSQIVYNFTTSSAVVIGGVWAYFKFLRGRTFSYRAELSVAASVEERVGWLYLGVTVEFRNTGLSKLPLNENMKYLQLYGMASKEVNFPGSAEWELLLTQKIFDQHQFVEAQEVVADTVVLRLRRAEATAVRYPSYKAEVWLGAPLRRTTKKGALWHGRAVAFTPAVSAEEALMISNGSRSIIGRILDRKESKHEQR